MNNSKPDYSLAQMNKHDQYRIKFLDWCRRQRRVGDALGSSRVLMGLTGGIFLNNLIHLDNEHIWKYNQGGSYVKLQNDVDILVVTDEPDDVFMPILLRCISCLIASDPHESVDVLVYNPDLLRMLTGSYLKGHVAIRSIKEVDLTEEGELTVDYLTSSSLDDPLLDVITLSTNTGKIDFIIVDSVSRLCDYPVIATRGVYGYDFALNEFTMLHTDGFAYQHHVLKGANPQILFDIGASVKSSNNKYNARQHAKLQAAPKDYVFIPADSDHADQDQVRQIFLQEL